MADNVNRDSTRPITDKERATMREQKLRGEDVLDPRTGEVMLDGDVNEQLGLSAETPDPNSSLSPLADNALSNSEDSDEDMAESGTATKKAGKTLSTDTLKVNKGKTVAKGKGK